MSEVAAHVPGWAWALIALGLVSLVTPLLGTVAWFIKRTLDDIRLEFTKLHAEILHEVMPLRRDVDQMKAMNVGIDRRLFVVEAQTVLVGKLRASDDAKLAEWACLPEAEKP